MTYLPRGGPATYATRNGEIPGYISQIPGIPGINPYPDNDYAHMYNLAEIS